MSAFLLNLETAEEFYRRCKDRGAITLEARMAIMKELVDELRVVKLNEKDLERQLNGKKVLKITRKRRHNEN